MTEASSIIEFSEDIADAEEPVPLPVGDYSATIQEAKQVESVQNPGSFYAAITFRIDPDSYPADYTDGHPDGTVITWRRLSLNDNKLARYKIKEFCAAIGAPTPTRTFDLNSLLGLGCVVRVGHNQYEGSTRAEIKKVLPF